MAEPVDRARALVQEIMERDGLSLRDVSRRRGINFQAVHNWLHPKRGTNPRLSTVARVLDACGYSLRLRAEPTGSRAGKKGGVIVFAGDGDPDEWALHALQSVLMRSIVPATFTYRGKKVTRLSVAPIGRAAKIAPDTVRRVVAPSPSRARCYPSLRTIDRLLTVAGWRLEIEAERKNRKAR